MRLVKKELGIYERLLLFCMAWRRRLTRFKPPVRNCILDYRVEMISSNCVFVLLLICGLI